MELGFERVLDGWHSGDGPRYRRLASAFARAVERGELLAGTRLPTERHLAAHLGIGRGTVTAAYDLLSKQGVVDRRQGRGTEVKGESLGARAAELTTAFQRNVIFRSIADPAEAGHADPYRDADRGPAALAVASPAGDLAAEPGEMVDLLASCAPPSPPILRAISSATASLDVTRIACDNGYQPLGHPPLRRAIADHLTANGQPTRDADVLVTSGAQQAVTLLAACYVKPGQVVVLEDPTFPGAVDAFRAAGARILTIPVRETGADLGLLGATIAENAVQAVYLTPTFQNPTGVTTPEADRWEIVRLSKATGVPIIEDNAVAWLSFGMPTPPPIGALAGDAPIISIGSLSKLFWGGLRIGWIRAPRPLIAHLARLKAVSDLGTSLISQAIAAELLADADNFRALRCRELSDRLDLLAGLLRGSLPDWRWRRPGGGVSVWARLPMGRAVEFAHLAARHGVSVVPGPVMSVTGSCEEFIRLPFDHEPAVIQEGVARLARAWKAYAATEIDWAGRRLHLVV